jgi:hypothetical protein
MFINFIEQIIAAVRSGHSTMIWTCELPNIVVMLSYSGQGHIDDHRTWVTHVVKKIDAKIASIPNDGSQHG